LGKELIFRFIVGGAIVSAFALTGDVIRPKSFAGLFGAAPSVALATLLLTIGSKGADYAALETRSMIGGAAAFFVYAVCVSRAMLKWQLSALASTTSLIAVWFAVAFSLWAVWLR
jgi:Protein of unknown function (DUF3147)